MPHHTTTQQNMAIYHHITPPDDIPVNIFAIKMSKCDPYRLDFLPYFKYDLYVIKPFDRAHPLLLFGINAVNASAPRPLVLCSYFSIPQTEFNPLSPAMQYNHNQYKAKSYTPQHHDHILHSPSTYSKPHLGITYTTALYTKLGAHLKGRLYQR